MRREEVPQDSENNTYGGVRKLIYAEDKSGNFVGVKSSGWEVESEATNSVLRLIQEQCDEAWLRATALETAPLEYYMYYRRMDLALLAQTTGLFQWRIRRHFKPEVFSKLNTKILTRYAEALGLDVATITRLPEQPLHQAAAKTA